MLDFCCFINIMIESNWEEERLYLTERQQFISIYGIKGGNARQEPEGRNLKAGTGRQDLWQRHGGILLPSLLFSAYTATFL